MRAAQSLFWAVLVLLVLWDWERSQAIDRFDEPPVIAAGSGTVPTGGHCALAPR